MRSVPFHPGQRAEFRRTVTEADLVNFAGVSGDFNPLHTDAVYAARSRFGQRVAHGMLRFRRPTRVGDTLVVWTEVASVREGKPILHLRVGCTNQEGETVVEGEAACLWEPVEEG
jgi:3-hydroxybutyryl-CoA dehydratase